MTAAGVVAEIRAAIAALRFDPDGGAHPSARAERIAAAVLGLLLLAGAVGTYAAASGLGLRMGGTPTDDAQVVPTRPTRRPPFTTVPVPAPTTPATPVPTVPATPDTGTEALVTARRVLAAP